MNSPGWNEIRSFVPLSSFAWTKSAKTDRKMRRRLEKWVSLSGFGFEFGSALQCASGALRWNRSAYQALQVVVVVVVAVNCIRHCQWKRRDYSPDGTLLGSNLYSISHFALFCRCVSVCKWNPKSESVETENENKILFFLTRIHREIERNRRASSEAQTYYHHHHQHHL